MAMKPEDATIRSAAQTMIDVVNSERPFTPEERAELVARICAVEVFIQTQSGWWNWTMAGTFASTFLLGVVFAKVFLQ